MQFWKKLANLIKMPTGPLLLLAQLGLGAGSAYGIDLIATDGPLIDVSAGVGIPKLIGFDVMITRLYPVTFGFGFGTFPIENAAKKQLDLDADDYRQETNGYTVIPSFYLDWGSFETFIRWYPMSEEFYLQAMYATWNIN